MSKKGHSNLSKLDRRLGWIFLSLAGFFITYILLTFDGTGGAGDSIQHYLFAKWAPQHPELYFHHWAKPLFTFISSPFAQFGITGIKVFNALVSFASVYLTYKTAVHLQLKNSFLVIPLMVCTPVFITMSFSGLTEPLFALGVISSVYFVVKKELVTACFIISFLPFIRTEGMFFIGIAFGYLAFINQWKKIPILLMGHVFYSVLGYFWKSDILWVFSENPYAGVNQVYGTGKLFHFAGQHIYLLGIPILILFGLGLLYASFFFKQLQIKKSALFFIVAGYWAFFLAHTIFWYFGIFGSMGLTRVFLGVLPLMSIISLYGVNLITEKILVNQPAKSKSVLKGIVICLIAGFPFVHNPAAVEWEKEMNLNDEQLNAKHISSAIKNIPTKRLVFAHPYLAVELDVDPWNEELYAPLTNEYLDHGLKDGDFVIWDAWFCPIQNNVDIIKLTEHPNLIEYELNDTSQFYRAFRVTKKVMIE